MSLLPYLLNEFLEDYRQPIYQQKLGLGLEELLAPRLMSRPFSGYLGPWRSMAAGDRRTPSLQGDQEELRFNLDVQQFKPDELNVKLVDDFVVIEGKHDERADQHGFIARQFTRRYKIPETVDPANITSVLSSDGVLTLKAPKKALPLPKGREIPITRTNQPALKQDRPNPLGQNTEE